MIVERFDSATEFPDERRRSVNGAASLIGELCLLDPLCESAQFVKSNPFGWAGPWRQYCQFLAIPFSSTIDFSESSRPKRGDPLGDARTQAWRELRSRQSRKELDPRFQHPCVHRLFESLQVANSHPGVRKLLGDAFINWLGHENLSRTGGTL